MEGVQVFQSTVIRRRRAPVNVWLPLVAFFLLCRSLRSYSLRSRPTVSCYGSAAHRKYHSQPPTPCWTRQELWQGGTVQSPRAASPQAPDWLRHSTASNAGSYCVLCFVLSREYHSPRRPSTRFMRHRAAVQTPRRALPGRQGLEARPPQTAVGLGTV